MLKTIVPVCLAFIAVTLMGCGSHPYEPDLAMCKQAWEESQLGRAHKQAKDTQDLLSTHLVSFAAGKHPLGHKLEATVATQYVAQVLRIVKVIATTSELIDVANKVVDFLSQHGDEQGHVDGYSECQVLVSDIKQLQNFVQGIVDSVGLWHDLAAEHSYTELDRNAGTAVAGYATEVINTLKDAKTHTDMLPDGVRCGCGAFGHAQLYDLFSTLQTSMTKVQISKTLALECLDLSSCQQNSNATVDTTFPGTTKLLVTLAANTSDCGETCVHTTYCSAWNFGLRLQDGGKHNCHLFGHSADDQPWAFGFEEEWSSGWCDQTIETCYLNHEFEIATICKSIISKLTSVITGADWWDNPDANGGGGDRVHGNLAVARMALPEAVQVMKATHITGSQLHPTAQPAEQACTVLVSIVCVAVLLTGLAFEALQCLRCLHRNKNDTEAAPSSMTAHEADGHTSCGRELQQSANGGAEVPTSAPTVHDGAKPKAVCNSGCCCRSCIWMSRLGCRSRVWRLVAMVIAAGVAAGLAMPRIPTTAEPVPLPDLQEVQDLASQMAVNLQSLQGCQRDCPIEYYSFQNTSVRFVWGMSSLIGQSSSSSVNMPANQSLSLALAAEVLEGITLTGSNLAHKSVPSEANLDRTRSNLRLMANFLLDPHSDSTEVPFYMAQFQNATVDLFVQLVDLVGGDAESLPDSGGSWSIST